MTSSFASPSSWLGGGRVTPEQVRSGTGKLLFFGQFTTMSLEDFHASLDALSKDRSCCTTTSVGSSITWASL
jgi:hypothetical protein